jgi:arylsulfatase A-like enzyme
MSGPAKRVGTLAALLAVVACAVTLGLSNRWRSRGAPPPSDERPATTPSGISSPVTTDRPDARRPNVVIFLIDTLRADRLGVHGYRKHDTSPDIDRLAQHGVVFENAYAPSPWTLPTVASLFVSAFPCEHQVLSRYERLAGSADTLAERLKRAGYTTYCLYANAFLAPEFGLHQGFDFQRGTAGADGKEVGAALGPQPAEPFFFYIHNLEPHNPYAFAPPHTPGFRTVSYETRRQIESHFMAYKEAGEHDYRRRLPLGTNDLTDEQDRHLQGLRELKDDWNELYDASVRLADSRVGSVIRALKVRGVWDNTLFVVVSDHGEEMDEHGGWLHDQSVYEELMHVPLIIRFPHDQLAGKRIAGVVSLVDVLPTICDWLEREDLAGSARGGSLLPLVQGTAAAPAETPVIPGMRHNTTRYYRPWATQRGDVNIIVRQDRWKGIWNVDLNTIELYDLGTDPLEQTNVAAQHASLADALRDHAEAWYARCQRSARETESVEQLDEETLRNLRSLGYVDPPPSREP